MLILDSCTSEVKFLKPEGDDVSVARSDKRKYNGELISVNENELYLKYDSKFYKTELASVSGIYVKNYSLRTKKIITLMPSIAISSILAFSPEFSDGDNLPIIIMAMSSLTTIAALFVGDPDVNFPIPSHDKDLNKLKLYCRYPQGLTEEQKRLILRDNNQEKFLNLPEK